MSVHATGMSLQKEIERKGIDPAVRLRSGRIVGEVAETDGTDRQARGGSSDSGRNIDRFQPRTRTASSDQRPLFIFLVVSERLDRIERSRAPGGIKAEKDSDGDRKNRGKEDRLKGDNRRPLDDGGDDLGAGRPERDTEETPDEGEDDRFH